ncbi:MAG: hypothetical protein IPJ82_22795 [Lewinellaceae bacterium]|nr:hypothetical protein [Lewinellaceae bacterium]
MKLPKVESLIIAVFIGCVLLWAVSKCSAKRSELVRSVHETGEEEEEERPARHDTIVVQQTPAQTVQTPVNTQSPGSSPAAQPAVAAPPCLPEPRAPTRSLAPNPPAPYCPISRHPRRHPPPAANIPPFLSASTA